MSNRRYEASTSFLAGRFRPITRPGLALTVLVGVLVLLLSTFSVVTEDVVAGDELVQADGPIERFLIDRRTAALTLAMRAFTTLGSVFVVVPLLLVVGLLARRARGSWRPLVFLTVIAAGATATSTVIKVVVARPRPETGALVHALGYAFPSGHSTSGAAAWLSSAVVLGSLTRSMVRRVVIGVVASVVVVLIGVSRVYLGVHAPTDVLAGWALGGLWLAATVLAGRLLVRRHPAATGAPGRRPS
ncbi:MAG: phosphoesterase PA-phosphatase related protein [Blastococcus sp.]|jgi:membrane-associated phospholipid phosphatase|nr:phosphoesterase PA-phosphatase related protein [Blastococcus sp.]